MERDAINVKEFQSMKLYFFDTHRSFHSLNTNDLPQTIREQYL